MISKEKMELDKNEDEKKSKVDFLLERFKNERSEYLNKIKYYSERLSNISDLIELQVEIHSQREIILEYYYSLKTHTSKELNKYNKLYKQRFEYYINNSDVRMDKKEIEKLISADLSDKILLIEYLENHLDFLKESIKTIDSIIYSIKNRIEIEKILKSF